MSQSTNRPPRLTLPDTLPASTMIHNYPYSNRPIKDSEFRILRIQSAPSPHEPLVAKLNICERMPAVPYEALSYVWGKDEGPHENLEILSTEDNPFRSNVSFRIRPNLASALKCFRNTREERALWTDAICIDQNNINEKSKQVPMMEKVYMLAGRVLVWLGEASDQSRIAFSFMRKIVDTEDFDELVSKEANTARQWVALESLMRWNWFSRRWIVQEIALANDADIWCGDDHISWTDFCHVVDLFKLHYQDIKALLIRPEYGYARNWLGEVEALGACQLVSITNNLFRKSNNGQIERRLITLESLVSRLTMFHAGQAHDTIYALVAIAKDIKSGFQSKKSVQPDASPVQTPEPQSLEGQEMPELPQSDLKRRGSAQMTLPHVNTPLNEQLRGVVSKAIDNMVHLKVPSNTEGQKQNPGKEKLLDLVEDVVRCNPRFRVDYRQTFHAVCMDFVEFAIVRSTSLDVILRPWVPKALKEEHNLPSWLISVDQYPYQQVEKGTFNRVNGDPLVGLNAMEPKRYGACGPTAPALRIDRRDNKNPENGWGFCCKDRESTFSCNGDHRSLFVTGFVFDEIGEVTDPATGGTIPVDWFEFCHWNWMDRLELPPDNLLRTLVADRETDGSHIPSYFRKTLHSIAFKRCASGGALNVQSILETTQHDRRSERLMNRIFAVTPNRRLFKTTKKTGYHLGLAPKKAKAGDKVCILYGCSVPVILRHHENTINGSVCQYYELIGDAFVNGIMEGHAVDENERSELHVKSQQFELR